MPRRLSVAPAGCLGGVVVDHVENDLESRGCSVLTMVLNRLRGRSTSSACRARKIQRVVAPVVPQATGDEMAVVYEGVYRHQLHRGDAQAAQ
jgi:hypothetical protein